MNALRSLALIACCGLSSYALAQEYADPRAYFAEAEAAYGINPARFNANGYSNITSYNPWPQNCCDDAWNGYCGEHGHCHGCKHAVLQQHRLACPRCGRVNSPDQVIVDDVCVKCHEEVEEWTVAAAQQFTRVS